MQKIVSMKKNCLDKRNIFQVKLRFCNKNFKKNSKLIRIIYSGLSCMIKNGFIEERERRF